MVHPARLFNKAWRKKLETDPIPRSVIKCILAQANQETAIGGVVEGYFNETANSLVLHEV